MTHWQCPNWLHPFARELWDDVVAELQRRGRTLLVHPSQVVMFCQCLAQYRLATLEIILEGQTVKEQHGDPDEEGSFEVLKVHPAFRVQATLVKQAEQLIKDLGLNEPLENSAGSALAGVGAWLDRARSGLQDQQRN